MGYAWARTKINAVPSPTSHKPCLKSRSHMSGRRCLRADAPAKKSRFDRIYALGKLETHLNHLSSYFPTHTATASSPTWRLPLSEGGKDKTSPRLPIENSQSNGRERGGLSCSEVCFRRRRVLPPGSHSYSHCRSHSHIPVILGQVRAKVSLSRATQIEASDGPSSEIGYSIRGLVSDCRNTFLRGR